MVSQRWDVQQGSSMQEMHVSALSVSLREPVVLAHQAWCTAEAVRGMRSLLLQPGGFLVLPPPLLLLPLPPGALRVHDPHLNQPLHNDIQVPSPKRNFKVAGQYSSRHKSRGHCSFLRQLMPLCWLPCAQTLWKQQ